MFKSLYWKLTLAFILVAFITAALVSVYIRATSANRLIDFVLDQQSENMQKALTQYYSSIGSWNGVAENWFEIQVWANSRDGREVQGFFVQEIPLGEHDRRGLFGLTDAYGRVIVSVDPRYPSGMPATSEIRKSGTPIKVGGETVGFLLRNNRIEVLRPEESLFLRRINQALILAVFTAMLVALAIGVFLARTLTQPLQALTVAAQKIGEGDYQQQVSVNSGDEIGQLAVAFNRMSAEVARVHYLRRKMTAEIAHDLRTPLTVIGGYVESMRDRVLRPTPERLALIYTEIERLQYLVGDLRLLSQADAGDLPLHPQSVSPKSLLERAAQLYKHHAERLQVNLSVQTQEALPNIRVDESRMMQVLDNLLSNALRYTPPDGKIELSARTKDGKVEIRVQDTGVGIPSEDIPLIFERFHRADPSRHAEAGERGLGLAIVKALVEAQGGQVRAESVAGQGAIFSLEFPPELIK